MWPLRVAAGNTHAVLAGFESRISRMACTFGVIGMRRRALSVFPE
jgi:hypothetical protein